MLLLSGVAAGAQEREPLDVSPTLLLRSVTSSGDLSLDDLDPDRYTIHRAKPADELPLGTTIAVDGAEPTK